MFRRKKVIKCQEPEPSTYFVRTHTHAAAPIEFDDLEKLKLSNLMAMKKYIGPRCMTSDIDDFPDRDPLFAIGDPDEGRCPVCLAYEKFDKFWACIEQ